MPANIARFERLAYLSFALFLLAGYLDQDYDPAGFVATGVLFGSISILLIWLTARRRKNWARWVYSILSAMGIAADTWGYFTSALDRADIVMMCSDIALVAALYYAWGGSSGDWFRGRGAAGQGALEPTAIEGC
jgi:hypothetical protein